MTDSIYYFPDLKNFHSLINEVKVGKGYSVFSERTDDSSAVQYFQVGLCLFF